MSQPVASVTEPEVLSDEIRDGLLQDLVAVSLILRHLEQTSPDESRKRLASASAAIEADVEVVRGLIDRLRAA